MKRAYLFPGQGSQFSGMGKNLSENFPEVQSMFSQANEILGFDISSIMFEGTDEALKQTNVTQPAIFLHSIGYFTALGKRFNADMVAGHSLGEFSALVAAGVLNWMDALKLVNIRANAMQKSCEENPGTMAAILSLDDDIVDETCKEIKGIVVAANYNCPGQLVISGELEAVNLACEALKLKGAKRAMLLPVGGAFHSPLMESARIDLEKAIQSTQFLNAKIPVYQNYIAMPVQDSEEIKANLISQLTGAVRWSSSIRNMTNDGAREFIEIGPGKVLMGLCKKISPETTQFHIEEILVQ